MITVCEQRAKEAGVADRCTFIKSDLLAIRPSLQHDICTGVGLFDYVRELLPLLSKMSSVIKDRAVISLPRLWTWRAPVRKVRLGLRGCDVYFYSMARTTKLLKRTRFRRYEAQRVGQLCCVTAFV